MLRRTLGHRAVEELALKSNKLYKIKPFVKSYNCSLSGVENKCKKMIDNNESSCDIAKFALDYVLQTICGMINSTNEEFASLPIVFVGGVMSNNYLRTSLENKYNCHFAQPEYSRDNACGVAVFGALAGGFI